MEASKVELTEEEEEGLRKAGLERREGVLGLYLLRDQCKVPIVPAGGVQIEGELKVKAERIRDELATHLKQKGTTDIAAHSRTGGGKISWQVEGLAPGTNVLQHGTCGGTADRITARTALRRVR